jgi:hypothetical protein
MDVILIVVSLLSLVLAAVMSLIAWRMARDERLRSAARIAALSAEIRDEPAEIAVAPATSGADLFLNDRAAPASPAEMFSTTRARPENSRFGLVAVVAALVVGSAAALTILFGGSGSGVTEASAATELTASPSHAKARAPKALSPLQLVALGHERDRDGLTVRGVLRNPSTGAEVSHLTAVVLLFNGDGGYIASGRAAVQASTLEPGGETTFVVTVSGAPEVERYRVSFRTDGAVVPHVDQRS